MSVVTQMVCVNCLTDARQQIDRSVDRYSHDDTRDKQHEPHHQRLCYIRRHCRGCKLVICCYQL